MTDTVISFYDCCPVGTGMSFSISASEGSSLYRIDRDRLRDAADLIFSVVSRVYQTIRRTAGKMIRKSVRAISPAGRSLIHWICNFRI